MRNQKGFTLIELLVVIGIIAILASVVIVALNPARQFAQARDTQRSSNVRAILDAVGQLMADNRGVWTCPSAGPLPTTATLIGTSTYDIGACVVPTYLSQMPVDPTTGVYVSTSSYYTAYRISQAGGATGRVTVDAPDTEIQTTDISITR